MARTKTPCPVCSKMTAITSKGRAFHGYTEARYGSSGSAACHGTYGPEGETKEQAITRSTAQRAANLAALSY